MPTSAGILIWVFNIFVFAGYLRLAWRFSISADETRKKGALVLTIYATLWAFFNILAFMMLSKLLLLTVLTFNIVASWLAYLHYNKK